MNKAVAIPYLVALVIGLILLAILVFIFLRAATSPQLPAQECRSRFIDWCTMCKNVGWTDKLKLPDSLKEACRDVLLDEMGFDIDDYNNCAHEDVKKDCCEVGVKNEACP